MYSLFYTIKINFFNYFSTFFEYYQIIGNTANLIGTIPQTQNFDDYYIQFSGC